MLYRTFHSNSLKALILSFFFMLFLWGRAFFYGGPEPLSLQGAAMPLWSSLIVPVCGQSAFLSAAFAFLIAFTIGFFLNRLVSRYGLLQRQSMLPLVVYALLVSGFLSVQRFNPVWVFTLFFLPGLERVLGAPPSGSFVTSGAQTRCFDAAFLTALGSLFYAKGLFLFPIVWVAMGLLRLFTLRSFIASVLGLILPYALSAGYFFFQGRTTEFASLAIENLLSNTGQFSHHPASQIYVALVLLFALIGVVNLVRYMPIQKIVTRKHFRVVIWLILMSAATGLTPFFSVELIPVFSLGLAIAIAFWLEKIKSLRWKEALLWLLLTATVSAQFLV